LVDTETEGEKSAARTKGKEGTSKSELKETMRRVSGERNRSMAEPRWRGRVVEGGHRWTGGDFEREKNGGVVHDAAGGG